MSQEEQARALCEAMWRSKIENPRWTNVGALVERHWRTYLAAIEALDTAGYQITRRDSGR